MNVKTDFKTLYTLYLVFKKSNKSNFYIIWLLSGFRFRFIFIKYWIAIEKIELHNFNHMYSRKKNIIEIFMLVN